VTGIVMFFLLVGGVLLQIALPGWFWLGQAKCPLLLCVVLYYALCRRPHVMLVAAVSAGFLQDALSEVPLGYSSLLFIVAGSISSRLRKTVLPDALTTRLTFGGVVGGAVTLALGVLLLRRDLVGLPLSIVLWRALWTGLLGCVCAPVVFAVAAHMEQAVGIVEDREAIDGIH
jgi:rod shape-determining protein MreD